MKIISRFKDYYDFAAGFDTDERKVFLRNETRVHNYGHAWRQKPLVGNVPHGWPLSKGDMKVTSGEYYGIVLFCDRAYLYHYDENTEQYTYSPEEIFDGALDVEPSKRFNPGGMKRHLRWMATSEHHIQNYSRPVRTEKFVLLEAFSGLNTLLRTPQAAVKFDPHGFAFSFFTDVRLADVQFNKAVSPQDAYTQVYNFVKFAEAEPDSDPANMQRFEGKGFDRKTSFRPKIK